MTHHSHEHDLGLQHDVDTLHRRGLGRRGLLGVLGGLGATGALTACSRIDRTASGAPDVDAAAGEIPEDTAGPYPGDGSNVPNVLSESGIVRQDITSSFGDASGYSLQLATMTRSVEEGFVATNVPV